MKSVDFHRAVLAISGVRHRGLFLDAAAKNLERCLARVRSWLPQ